MLPLLELTGILYAMHFLIHLIAVTLFTSVHSLRCAVWQPRCPVAWIGSWVVGLSVEIKFWDKANRDPYSSGARTVGQSWVYSVDCSKYEDTWFVDSTVDFVIIEIMKENRIRTDFWLIPRRPGFWWLQPKQIFRHVFVFLNCRLSTI